MDQLPPSIAEGDHGSSEESDHGHSAHSPHSDERGSRMDRRDLSQLTPAERRKLANRESAQRSRDKKNARQKRIEEENKILRANFLAISAYCVLLQQENNNLKMILTNQGLSLPQASLNDSQPEPGLANSTQAPNLSSLQTLSPFQSLPGSAIIAPAAPPAHSHQLLRLGKANQLHDALPPQQQANHPTSVSLTDAHLIPDHGREPMNTAPLHEHPHPHPPPSSH
eukprot:TRINITY_DN5686_c0_g1::TRINITY_DN5686_c0_g1_i1::g.12029::m.12029 TRINITY_DN5686_c0_g1::TRINITY_DN5686_c0_g1_i1::g.12029  ORF type:complete len:225 (-),score=4.71,bZIP_1/PF00170.16/0.00027,bZIP_2/PF07716.10/0.0096,bZIP_Maf/PF03131.12/0.065,DUF4256/PF14066.1/0.15 TRINITY_DN5686_c0_g1_i1:128-802(-)